MEILQQRLIDLRNDRNLSQKDLAKKIGVSASALCFWEKGINEPKATYLLNLANYFGTSTDYLLGLEDDFGAPTAQVETINYSSEERKLIEDYRELNSSGKRLINETIKTLRATNVGSDENKILPKV